MILQALCAYYDALARRGEIAPPGWSTARVSFALDLDEDGALCGLIPLMIRPAGAQKEIPQPMQVPERVKKTSGVCANFLCENSSYLLGIDARDKPARALECFEAAKSLHLRLLRPVDSPAARAVCAFFEAWNPQQAAESPALAPCLPEIMQGANLVFAVNGLYAHDDPLIRAAWQAHRAARSAGAATGVCLVTGKRGPIARLHPAIRGILGAQSSGASLVSFNAPAFESYGHEGRETGQGLNAPVSEEAAFKYAAVLGQLVADREHIQYIGDTAVVCWAEDAEPMCRDVFSFALLGDVPKSGTVTDKGLRDAVKKLARGQPVDVNGIPLRPQTRFYVLGLSPNAARLSVRFFLQDSLERMLAHVQAHQERLTIVKPSYIANGALPLWRLLDETANPNSRDRKAPSPMAGAVLRAILTGGSYPVSLFEQTMLRIRAERKVTYGRAAILKAFFINNREFHVPEGVLKVELNDQANHPPYVLGRLFAVLERVQTAANPGLNATIKDKYFCSACATPATIFSLLHRLSQSHLRKLNGRQRIYFEKQIGELMGRITETLPARLSLPDQGTFYLGYYHQAQKFFEKKEKGGNENVRSHQEPL